MAVDDSVERPGYKPHAHMGTMTHQLMDLEKRIVYDYNYGDGLLEHAETEID